MVFHILTGSNAPPGGILPLRLLARAGFDKQTDGQCYTKLQRGGGDDMPVLPCRSPASLPRYAAGYSGTMALAALCGVLGGVVLGRGIPFHSA